MASKVGKSTGKSEWISPHKLSLLVLIKALCSKEKDGNDYSQCITRCRHYLSLFMLEILQVPDVELNELCQKLRNIDAEQELDNALIYWLQEINSEGVSSVIDFFQSLEELFSGKEPALQKASLFGLFVRRMSLLFHKMTFNQVSHFHTLLQEYMSTVPQQSDDNIDESMESIKSLTLDSSLKEKESTPKIRASNRQAQFFLEKQASLVQNNEGAALSPVELQNKISQLLDMSPDITEAHFVSYLNCLRVGEFNQAIDSLYHYFDQQMWNTPQPKVATDGNEIEDEKCRRFRYAALNLAALHCHFGHTSEALAALREAIQIAQETNDHICLEHCLGWLYRLEQEGSSQATVLLDRFVSRAAELKLPYLTSLSMLTHARHDAMIGIPPPKVFLAMSHINVINSQNSLQDLTATTHAQHAAIWQCYGKCRISSMYSQLQLNHSNTSLSMLSLDKNGKQSNGLVNGEASCLSLCNLAKLHADQCMYQEASEILNFCKSCFPQPADHSKKWMLVEALIEHDRALYKGNIEQAQRAVRKIVPLDESEAKYRSALNMIHEGNTAEAFPILQKLLQDCKKKTTTSKNETKSVAELHANVLLALCKLYTVSGNPLATMPHLLDCLTLACSHYLDHNAALASICIGHLQLLLGLPAKAILLVKTSMAHLLSHGSLYIQACAQFLLVKCQLATSMSSKSNTKRKQALLSALPTLDSVQASFRKLEALHKVRDVLYHQARIYEELGYAEERNRCASECCQLMKEQSQHSYNLSLCCL